MKNMVQKTRLDFARSRMVGMAQALVEAGEPMLAMKLAALMNDIEAAIKLEQRKELS